MLVNLGLWLWGFDSHGSFSDAAFQHPAGHGRGRAVCDSPCSIFTPWLPKLSLARALATTGALGGVKKPQISS